jgi:MOSC domain-containing protein YiiM
MQILSINVGRAQPLATREGSVMSAIGKRAIDREVLARPLGMDGDEQADLSVHGGLSKAIYAYPHEHYAVWASICQQSSSKSALPSEVWVDGSLRFGAFGENLTLQGLTETQVWVGDQLHFADCVLAVTEPRLPCFKFNLRMGFSHAAKMMVQSGTCGFYLAVLREGSLSPGETFELRPGPREVSIPELFELRTRKAKQLDMF